MFQRAQQEGAKFAQPLIGAGDRVALQQANKEFLRQVLRVVRRMSMAADKSVNRKPIHTTKRFQRFAGFSRIQTGSPAHQTPASLLELRRLAALGVEVFGYIRLA